MSQYYELSVAVYGFIETRAEHIADAIEISWNFERPDYGMFVPKDGSDPEYSGLPMTGDGQVTYMQACAQGSVSGPPEDTLKELTEAIWDANDGKYCIVECTSTYLENLPYDEHKWGKEEHKKWLKLKRK